MRATADSAESAAVPDADMAALVGDAHRSTVVHHKDGMEVEDEDSEGPGPQPAPEPEESGVLGPQPTPDLEESEVLGPQPTQELEDSEGPGPQPSPELELEVETTMDGAAHYSPELEERSGEGPQPVPESALGIEEGAVCVEDGVLGLNEPLVHMEEDVSVIEADALCTEEGTLGLGEPTVHVEEHAAAIEANALCVEESPLDLKERVVHMEEGAAVIEADALCVEDSTLGLEVPTVRMEEEAVAIEEGALGLEETIVHMEQDAICVVEDVLILEGPAVGADVEGEHVVHMEEDAVDIRDGAVCIDDSTVRIEEDVVGIKKDAGSIEDSAVDMKQGAVRMDVDAVGIDEVLRAEDIARHVACTEEDTVGIQGIQPAPDSPTQLADHGITRVPEEGVAHPLPEEGGTERLVPGDESRRVAGQADLTQLAPDDGDLKRRLQDDGDLKRLLPVAGDLKRRRIDSGIVGGVNTTGPERLRKRKDQWLREVLGPVRKTKRASRSVEYYQIRIPESPSPERMDDSSSSSEDSLESDYSKWVHQFCCEFPQLVKVPTWYLNDNFSMQGLNAIFRRKYRGCLAIIVGESVEIPDVFPHDVYMLYLFAHQRYVQTWDGMCAVKSKIFEGDYGYCLRVLCKKNPLIPVQMSDGSEALVGFCTACLQCVVHRQLTSTEIPHLGIAYGDSFAELLLMNFPKLRRLEEPEKFVPRLYGYRLAKKKRSTETKPREA
eukprot:GEMP01014446.1.p1 GENE.GEMP01014446.1~~GEMP01014446.1.p1  ORF type:complete len:722 (+),score=225.43 GEMP01014446.1:207-2372(+)